MRQSKKNRATAIEYLLRSSSVSEAAETIGVNRATIYRWLKDADFQRDLRETRQVAYGHAVTRLCGLASEAVSVLGKGLNGEEITRVQLRAAMAVLTFAATAYQLDLEDRLCALEAKLNQVTGVTT